MRDDNSQNTISVPLANILPHPENPRGDISLDAPDIVELANEIAEAKMLYHAINVVAMPECDGYYRVVAGHRRRAALLRLGWESAPVSVRDWDEREQRRVMLAENLKREDLTPLQEAKAYVRMREDWGEYTEVARRLGITTAQIQSRVVILRLSPKVQALFESEEMPTVAAGSLVKIDDPSRQERLALQVMNRQMTVKQLAERVKRIVEDVAADKQVDHERMVSKPKSPKPAVKTRDYCRTEADADLEKLNGTSLTFADVRAAMTGVCDACQMGKYREICGACALPQMVERLVANYAQRQA